MRHVSHDGWTQFSNTVPTLPQTNPTQLCEYGAIVLKGNNPGCGGLTSQHSRSVDSIATVTYREISRIQSALSATLLAPNTPELSLFPDAPQNISGGPPQPAFSVRPSSLELPIVLVSPAVDVEALQILATSNTRTRDGVPAKCTRIHINCTYNRNVYIHTYIPV